MRRVVITGLGIVSPAGIGKTVFWENIIAGKSCTKKITRFDASGLTSQIAAEVENFEPKKYFNNEKDLRRSDISTQFAVAAAKMAISDAGIDLSQEDPYRIGAAIGVGIGGPTFLEEQVQIVQKKGLDALSPFTSIAFFCCAPVGFISIEFGIKGSNTTTSTGCTSAHVAIGSAFNDIRYGKADMVFAGGTEAPVTPITVQSFCAIHALSTRNDEPHRASRPFDKERNGFVIAEGCGIIFLEELEHALKRNAHIYAELVGYASTCNAYHMTAPAPEAEAHAKAINLAMKEANVKPEDVSMISAHGSSTKLNEKSETFAIKKVFGECAKKIPVNALKSMVGHSLGGAGGIQAVANALSMETGIIPPTINYEYPDPDCDLDYVPNKARKEKIKTIVQNGCGFSGVNAAIVFKKYEG